MHTVWKPDLFYIDVFRVNLCNLSISNWPQIIPDQLETVPIITCISFTSRVPTSRLRYVDLLCMLV